MNYKYSILKNYLNIEEKKTSFNFLVEKKRLGTIGSLSLIDKTKITENFYVTNCDILVNANLKKIYNFHKKQKSLLTLIVTKKKMKFAYGACQLNSKNNLQSIKEKPEHTYLVNTGFYIMNKKILNYIKHNKKTDINELIDILKKKNIKISCFTINQKNWSDYGNWVQYDKELRNFS